MFEGLLEKLLQRVLGQYVEELDRKQLSISVIALLLTISDLARKHRIRKPPVKEGHFRPLKDTAQHRVRQNP
jgi:hypothetical protein